MNLPLDLWLSRTAENAAKVSADIDREASLKARDMDLAYEISALYDFERPAYITLDCGCRAELNRRRQVEKLVPCEEHEDE